MGISLGAVSLTTETVILMVIAVIALALLWMFFSGYLKFAAFGLEDITEGFKKWFCDNWGKAVSFVCKLS